ncbi:hypothetical protein Tco_0996250 [Tanacetum coccineum]
MSRWVLDVPKYDLESEKESWGNSNEEDDDDEDDFEDDNDDDDGDNDDGDDNDGNDDDEADSERIKSDREEIPNLNHEEEKNDDEEMMFEEEEDEVTKELYNDVNVNLGTKDAEMTDADQGGVDQQNVSQVSALLSPPALQASS